MIPTLIFVGLLVGLFAPRWAALIAVALLGIAWATLVATMNGGGNFLGGLAFGVPNAAVGVVLGAGIRALVSPLRNFKPGSESRR